MHWLLDAYLLQAPVTAPSESNAYQNTTSSQDEAHHVWLTCMQGLDHVLHILDVLLVPSHFRFACMQTLCCQAMLANGSTYAV